MTCAFSLYLSLQKPFSLFESFYTIHWDTKPLFPYSNSSFLLFTFHFLVLYFLSTIPSLYIHPSRSLPSMYLSFALLRTLSVLPHGNTLISFYLGTDCIIWRSFIIPFLLTASLYYSQQSVSFYLTSSLCIFLLLVDIYKSFLSAN